ncbi:MAG: ATPase [Alphaproteobacteria bacterium]|nr:ATPase [Alphaproteobacteria bacterium]MCB9929801.1 ATPase [Alphaproteobacteria bacterium]
MKRFYKQAAAGEHEGGLAVLLDGRPVRTPKRTLLHLPTPALAAALAEEWQAQGDEIEPAAMPLTQLASTALDRVAPQIGAVAAEIAKFAETDLLCYRADQPDSLVQAQHAAWAPLLAWADEALGARLVVTQGINPIPQPAEAIARIQAAVAGYDAFPLAALSVATAVTGSVVIALALAQGRISGDQAADAAQVDEAHQMERWGHDPEAEARLERLRAELRAAERFLALL